MNSGLSLYLANSSSHASSSLGGRLPVTGRHSVILSPDSVSRVRPPNTTIPKTLAAEPRSQYATDFLDVSGHDDGLALEDCCALEPIFWLSAPRGDDTVSCLATVDD